MQAGVGPPVVQMCAGVGAFVAGEVGEELVDAESVVEVAAGRDPMQPGGAVAPPRRRLSPGCGDDERAEVREGVVVRVAAARETERPEPLDQAQLGERGEVALGVVEAREQGVVGDLEAG